MTGCSDREGIARMPDRIVVGRAAYGAQRPRELSAFLMSLYTADATLRKLTNVLMRDGKKTVAQRIINDAFWILKREHDVAEPALYTREAIDLARPVVELARHRASGRALQIPKPVTPERSLALALRFIRAAVREERKERGAARRLAAELIDLHREQGVAWRKRLEMYKMAEANKAYAHLR